MVLLIVVIGGITRLTESGLSITEWRPISGVIPPTTDASWTEEFARYQATAEYQQLNRGMSLKEFKSIYFWEWLHRIWGRLVGAAFAIPLLYFLVRGRIPPPLRKRLFVILALIAFEGALGWFMVQSGLADRTDVSQYRLAAHLATALLIYSLLLWTGISLLPQLTAAVPQTSDLSGARTRVLAVLALVALTIVSGAFVAGLNAGTIHNTFPLMAGRLIPAEYLQLRPLHLNFFENPSSVQFNHRLIGIFTFAAAFYLWIWSRRRELPSLTRIGVRLAVLLACAQVGLGIAALLSRVPIQLAAAHQFTAVLLLSAALLALRGVSRPGGGMAAREVLHAAAVPAA
jgi:cytochrome c oxidase assembly protein subunit 15